MRGWLLRTQPFFRRTTRRACPNYNRRWSIHLDRRNPAVLAHIYSAARPAQKTKTIALSFRAYGEFAGHVDDRKSGATGGRRISRGRTPQTGRAVTDSGVTMKCMYARRELALYLRRASDSAPQLASTPIANNPVWAAEAFIRSRLQPTSSRDCVPAILLWINRASVPRFRGTASFGNHDVSQDESFDFITVVLIRNGSISASKRNNPDGSMLTALEAMKNAVRGKLNRSRKTRDLTPGRRTRAFGGRRIHIELCVSR